VYIITVNIPSHYSHTCVV